jgi:hypothetical protein
LLSADCRACRTCASSALTSGGNRDMVE